MLTISLFFSYNAHTVYVVLYVDCFQSYVLVSITRVLGKRVYINMCGQKQFGECFLYKIFQIIPSWTKRRVEMDLRRINQW